MRLFTAALLPEALRIRTAEEAAALLAGVPGLRRVREPNLHITVRFLGTVEKTTGDINTGDVGAIERAIAEAAATVRPARVMLTTGFSAFPRPQRPRIVHRPVHDPEGVLTALESAVSTAVEPLGFPPESSKSGRAYTPHITVARVRSEIGAVSVADVLVSGRKRSEVEDVGVAGTFLVNEIALVESELTPHGSHYSVRATFPLFR